MRRLFACLLVTACRRSEPSKPAAFELDLCTGGTFDVDAVLSKQFDSVERYDYAIEVFTSGKPCAKASDEKACVARYEALKRATALDRSNIYFVTSGDDASLFFDDTTYRLPSPTRATVQIYAAWALVTHGGPGRIDCRANNASLDASGVRIKLASPCMLERKECPESAYEEIVHVTQKGMGIEWTTAKGGGGHPSR